MNDKQDLTTGTISKKLIAYAGRKSAPVILQPYGYAGRWQNRGRNRACRNQQRLYAQFYYQLCVYRHYNGRYGISRPV